MGDKSELDRELLRTVGSKECKLDTVKLLLEKGANVNAKTNDGGTVLSTAKERNYLAFVEFLLEHGAK